MQASHPNGLELRRLAQVPVDEVELLWIDDYRDGPLSGVARYQGEKCFFLVVDRDAEPRRWVLYRMTPEQLAEEEKWHALFVAHVGGPFAGGPLRSREEAAEKFYEPYKRLGRAHVFEAGQALGWFE